MRVTDKMGFNQVTSNLQKNRAEMNDLQNQAATQKRINKPSDDPVAAARVLGARTDEKMNKQFLKNIDIAKSFLEATDQSLAELTESLVRAKELTIQAANDPGASAETRRVTGQEIQQIYSQSVQIGNRKLGERYLFGGYQTNKAPFNAVGDYSGDDGAIKIQINKDAYMPMNIPGEQVLLGRAIGEDGSLGKTIGTPKSIEELQDYKQEEQDLIKQKEMVLEESDAVQLRGPASVAGGSREGPRQAQVGGPGSDFKTTGVNILATLKNLEIGLTVNDKETIQEAIDNIDQAISQVVQTRAQVGSRISATNNTADSLQKMVLENRSIGSQLEDADLFQTVSDIQKNESTLKATLETSGKIIQPSLMDFIK